MCRCRRCSCWPRLAEPSPAHAFLCAHAYAGAGMFCLRDLFGWRGVEEEGWKCAGIIYSNACELYAMNSNQIYNLRISCTSASTQNVIDSPKRVREIVGPPIHAYTTHTHTYPHHTQVQKFSECARDARENFCPSSSSSTTSSAPNFHFSWRTHTSTPATVPSQCVCVCVFVPKCQNARPLFSYLRNTHFDRYQLVMLASAIDVIHNLPFSVCGAIIPPRAIIICEIF